MRKSECFQKFALSTYSTRHRNVPVLELYNGRRTEEILQSVGRFLTTSRRLHCRSKDVPFLWNGCAVFNKTVMVSTCTVN